MRTHSNGTNKELKRSRWSAYLTEEEKAKLDQELERVAKTDKLREYSNATLASRIIEFGLRLDLASIAKYLKTHSRRQTPARP